MCHKHLTLQTAARHFTWKPTQEPWLGALMSLFLFCGYTLNLLLVYIWILNDLDIDGKYISTYALERTRRGRVQRSSPLRCPERVLWNMVSRRGMPAAETIGADTIDVGLLSDLNTGRWFHDVWWFQWCQFSHCSGRLKPPIRHAFIRSSVTTFRYRKTYRKTLRFFFTITSETCHFFRVEDLVMWLVVWNIWIIFPYIGNNHPNWRIHNFFLRGRAQPPTSHGFFTSRSGRKSGGKGRLWSWPGAAAGWRWSQRKLHLEARGVWSCIRIVGVWWVYGYVHTYIYYT